MEYSMKSRILLIVVALAVCLVSCGKEQQEPAVLETKTASAGESGYTYQIQIEKMVFQWAVDNSQLKVKLAAETEGWVGIGFNPSEQMKDANFIIGIVKDGVVTVTDEHGTDNKLHKEDSDIGGASDVSDASGSEGSFGTEIAFSIPLAGSDTLDTPIDLSSDITILLAYGKTDRLVQQHIMRSELTVNLSNGNYTVVYVKG